MKIPGSSVERAYTVVKYIAIINFITFMIVSLFIGGSAVGGKQKDGHYYVVNHGKYTEVSKTVWDYSEIHTLSLVFTHPLAIVLGIINHFSKRSSK